MKRIYIIFLLISIFTFYIISCKNSDADEVVEVRKPKSGSIADIIKNPATADAPLDTSHVAKMTFNELSFDFGTVLEDTKVSHQFKFKNTGKVPLVINDARSSCGCTVAEYPKTAINPGDTSSIKVVFNTKGKIGEQQKPVTLTANTFPAETKIFITGIVKQKTQK